MQRNSFNTGQIIINTPNVYPYSFLKDPGGSLRPIISKVLGSGGTKAYALNDSGQVVGAFSDSSTHVSAYLSLKQETVWRRIWVCRREQRMPRRSV